jgi:hypothetical protein
MKTIIYKLDFPNDNRTYIGKTTQGIKVRLAEHLKLLRYGTHHSKKLQEAWPTCGEPTISILAEVEEGSNDKEIELISLYNSFIDGFNGNAGGGNTGFGHSHCAAKYHKEDYEAILHFLATTSWSAKEIANELEVSQKVVESIMCGNSHKNLSTEYPELYNTATSKTRKGHYQVRQRPDIVDPSGNRHQVFNVKEFAEKFNLVYSCLLAVINGKRNSTAGWSLYKESIVCTPL